MDPYQMVIAYRSMNELGERKHASHAFHLPIDILVLVVIAATVAWAASPGL